MVPGSLTTCANKNPGAAAPGFLHAVLSIGRLQLTVFVEHGAAVARDAPAMGSERRATAQQAVPSHATRAIAHSGCRWLARGKLGKVDRAGGSCRNADEKASGKHCFHAVGPSLTVCWISPQ